MINIKKYQDTNTFNLSIGSKIYGKVVHSATTRSTSVALRVQPQEFVSFDVLTGNEYLSESFKAKTIIVDEEGDFVLIKFSNEQGEEDKLETDDALIKNNVVVYIKDWQLTQFKINKSILAQEAREISYQTI
jgi:hypothetical protein